MSAFIHMAVVLEKKYGQPATSEPTEKMNLTEQIRNHLREVDCPMTSAEIKRDLNLPTTNTVNMLIKHDIKKGKVFLIDGYYSYNKKYDAEDAEKVRLAIKLLRARGYFVKAPKA